ncbi:hypothetical protein TI05_18735 [Achromatium sp. WMS3]|nr:hypothetical protein TI05_18735 [Achromatium sp. WMS3]
MVSRKYQQMPQILPGLREDQSSNRNRGFFIRTGTMPSAQPKPIISRLRIWIDRHVLGVTTARNLIRVVPNATSTEADTADLRVVHENSQMLLLLPNNHILLDVQKLNKNNITI